MLEHLGESAAAQEIERAVAKVLAERGPKTPDLGGNATTTEVGKTIAAEISVFQRTEVIR